MAEIQLRGLRRLIHEGVPEEMRGTINDTIDTLNDERGIQELLTTMKAVIGLQVQKGNEFYLYLFEDRNTALAAMNNYRGDLKSLVEECEKYATMSIRYSADEVPIIFMEDRLLDEIEKYTQKPT